ncbi:MAG: hypothetical protein HQL29_01630 [Candidatus Omnitrophica bacterium]|nr:hypothetical protein [Candidatus Omnitrophota bacterium]
MLREHGTGPLVEAAMKGGAEDRNLSLFRLVDILAVSLDAEAFKKCYSPEFESMFFDKSFRPDNFKIVKDETVRSYLISQLVALMDTVQSQKSLKKLLSTFCVLNGEDPAVYSGFFFEEIENDNWMNYAMYAKVLRSMGDSLSSDPVYFEKALQVYTAAMDNLQDGIFKEIGDSVKENDLFREYVIDKANSGNIEAIRMLLAERKVFITLCGKGLLALQPNNTVRAYIDNQFNRIVSYYSDTVKRHEMFLADGYFPPLLGKFTDEILPVTISEIEGMLKDGGITLSEAEIYGIIREMNCDTRELKKVIVPKLSITDTGYRGTREKDNVNALYTTRAITTAVVHYGWKGGEFAGRRSNGNEDTGLAAGRTIVWEIDYALAGKISNVDRFVSLAVKMAEPMPSYSYKRGILLEKKSAALVIKEFMEYQSVETAAEDRILKAVKEAQGLTLSRDRTGEEERILADVRSALTDLRPDGGKAALTKDYYEKVYGSLEFFIENDPLVNIADISAVPTISFISKKLGRKLNMPPYERTEISGETVQTVMATIIKKIFDENDLLGLAAYLDAVSPELLDETAQSSELRAYFRKLLNKGLSRESNFNFTLFFRVMEGAGLLKYVLPGLDAVRFKERREMRIGDERVKLTALDHAFAMAESAERDIKSGEVTDISPSMLYIAIFGIEMSSARDHSGDWYLLEDTLKKTAASLGFNERDIALFYEIIQLEKEISRETERGGLEKNLLSTRNISNFPKKTQGEIRINSDNLTAREVKMLASASSYLAFKDITAEVDRPDVIEVAEKVFAAQMERFDTLDAKIHEALKRRDGIPSYSQTKAQKKEWDLAQNEIRKLVEEYNRYDIPAELTDGKDKDAIEQLNKDAVFYQNVRAVTRVIRSGLIQRMMANVRAQGNSHVDADTDLLIKTAVSAGLSIPTNIHDGRYTLMVDGAMYRNEKEKESDVRGYRLADGKYICAGDRFEIETADTENADNIIAHLGTIFGRSSDQEAYRHVIVAVSGEMPPEDILRIENAAHGIRIIRADTERFNEITDADRRRDIRFGLYAMMLAARRITEEDVMEESSVYKLLKFFLDARGDEENDNSSSLIEAIVKGKLTAVIKYNISLLPAAIWDKPEYYAVTAALISA